MNGLKVCFLVDSHSLTGYGMREFQSLGMQIQPFGFLSVELIADNGAVQSERMGGMHPELMGASGAGIKGDAGMIVLAFQHFKSVTAGLPCSVCTIAAGGRAGSGIAAAQPFLYLERLCLEATRYSAYLRCGL